jgi:hypothetical protein
MSIGDYLIAAPWWHWLFFLLIAAVLSKWRPLSLSKDTHTHEHKHVHTGGDSK